MPKILLVNNYLRGSMRIKRLNREIERITGEEPLTVHTAEVPHIDTETFDAVILSGGDAPLNHPEIAEKYAAAAAWIRCVRRPVLGICFGHQLLGLAYGGRVARLGRRFEGFYEVEVIEPDGLFEGLPHRIRVYKSNIRVVARAMPGFRPLARCGDYEVEAFRHREQPIFGVQFHPENYSDTERDGRRVLENFFRLIGG